MSREVRKTVTVFFADVVGSTALGERLDPEALRLVMSRWFALAEATLERHGGTVEKFIGDAVMAVFGVPLVHEDDALRAVRAAVELQSQLEQLNSELLLSPGIRLDVRTGITTGEVVAAADDVRQNLVTGDVVNTAKRLEEAAGAGEILLGAVTAQLVEGAATIHPVAPLVAKGKSLPVEAWQVTAVDPTADGVRRRSDGSLVGRRRPLQRLRAAIDLAERQRSCVPVFVLGPPGIGKSRLAREFFAGIGDNGTVLTGRCIPYGRGITFWALGEIIGAAGGVAALALDGPDAATVRERLEVAIGDSSAAVPSDEIFWAVRRAVETLARDGPLVLCIDDLHLAEPMLLDLVEYLVGWSRDAPVVLLGLARPELNETRPLPVGAVVIELEPLSAGECGELLDDLGVDDVALRGRIVEAAGGNPLFIEQLAAMVGELDTSGTEIEVPPSITAVLDARLDRLPAVERAILERASVVGKEFWRDAVTRLTPPALRNDVASSLLSLTRRGLIEPSPSSPLLFDDVSRFRHALIRDAAYAGLPKAERAELHELFATSVDGTPTAGNAAPDEIVGFHLEQACRYRHELGLDDGRTALLGETAGRRLGAAARRALTREDVLAASFLLERAVRLLPLGDPERLEFERERAQALWELGQAERAEEASRALLEHAAAVSDPIAAAHARLGLQHARLFDDDVEAGRLAVQEAIDVFEEAGDELGLARAWRRLSWLEQREGAHGAAEHAAREAVRYAIASDDRREEALAVDALCTSLLYGPTPVETALGECHALLGRARASPTLEAIVLSTVAGLEAMRGHFDDANSAYARAKELFEELGLRIALAGLTQVGVPLALLAGDLEAAEREARLGLEILASVGNAAVQAPLLADALLAAGRIDDARAALAVIDPARTPQHVPWQVTWRSAEARIEARSGGDATGLAHEAVALAQGGDDPNLAGEALAALAETLELAGKHGEATATLEQARAAFERKGNLVAAASLGGIMDRGATGR